MTPKVKSGLRQLDPNIETVGATAEETCCGKCDNARLGRCDKLGKIFAVLNGTAAGGRSEV